MSIFNKLLSSIKGFHRNHLNEDIKNNPLVARLFNSANLVEAIIKDLNKYSEQIQQKKVGFPAYTRDTNKNPYRSSLREIWEDTSLEFMWRFWDLGNGADLMMELADSKDFKQRVIIQRLNSLANLGLSESRDMPIESDPAILAAIHVIKKARETWADKRPLPFSLYDKSLFTKSFDELNDFSLEFIGELEGQLEFMNKVGTKDFVFTDYKSVLEIVYSETLRLAKDVAIFTSLGPHPKVVLEQVIHSTQINIDPEQTWEAIQKAQYPDELISIFPKNN
jgi:hypothetical protein